MICIECTNPNIDCLFSKYKSEYIKLTICPKCGKIADKYIEYDNVILFIDILLLKKQAYRHMTYNATEIELLKDPRTLPDKTDLVKQSLLRESFAFFARYKKLIRFIIIIILFEVYLFWAYEEKRPTRSRSIGFILEQDAHVQYLYFILKSVSEQFLLNFMIQILFRSALNWGSTDNKNINKEYQRGYYNSVLLTGVLISSSVKLFPILMLIWPYDKTTISSSFINFIGFINIIEALRVISGYRYLAIITVLVVSTSIQLVFSKAILSILVHYYSCISLNDIFLDEYNALISQSHNYNMWVDILKDNFLN
ncbi:Arv1-like family-domain-containing protein [Scheffersomyces xylosifermentans]|uniref:Arv1-like family-domain-containing protein n=1 Tax=Scheffersomyces xylosifermentans TaxID=1304137 RepID=UPI00315DD658